jgi:hypothetical protein
MRFLIVELRHKSNENILEELKIQSVTTCIHSYRSNWKLRVRKMGRKRIPKEIIF